MKEFKGSIKERFLSSSNIKELKAVDVSVGPLILTRCKSKPARIGEKFDLDERKFLNNNSYINKYLRLYAKRFAFMNISFFFQTLIVISCKCRYFCCQWGCKRDNKKFLQVRSCLVENLRMNDLEMYMLLIVSFSNVVMMVFKYRCEQYTL